ncbi:MAG: DUF2089 domain-containing protein [Chloroflexota bacterium]
MRKILESCPTCGGDLAITEVTCTVCDTVVRSQYAPCPFCALSPEDLAFMLVFVKNRGNVKDMERELGVSYWTIRGRLNEVITAMGFEAPADEADSEPASTQGAGDRQAVLDALKQGEITPEEAATQLSRLR